jgi:hypothetical protein
VVVTDSDIYDPVDTGDTDMMENPYTLQNMNDFFGIVYDENTQTKNTTQDTEPSETDELTALEVVISSFITEAIRNG